MAPSQDKDVNADMVTVLEPMQNGGTARKRIGAPATDGTSGASCSRSLSPTDSADTNMSDEQMDAIIEKLPHWIDQLGGIRNLVMGGLLLLLMLGPVHQKLIACSSAPYDDDAYRQQQPHSFTIMSSCSATH